MAEDDYLRRVIHGKMQKKSDIEQGDFIQRQRDRILDEYAALKRKKNPRAKGYYSMHKEYLDITIEDLREREKRLRNSGKSNEGKLADKIIASYGHLF